MVPSLPQRHPFLLTWQSFRERANVWLYKSKESVLGTFQWLNLLVNVMALVVLALYYGYAHEPETATLLFQLVKASFGFYVFHYGIRGLYHFHPSQFLRETWPEGIVMALLLAEGAGDVVLGTPLLGEALNRLVPSITDFSTVLILSLIHI